MKYTMESLSEINGRFLGSHYRLAQSDVDMANKYISEIEKSRSMETPKPGDVLRYTNKHGDYFPFAHIDRIEDNGDAYICTQGSSYICGFNENGNPYFSTSGGPWEHVPVTKMKYIGATEKGFWRFGSCGACADGGIDFYAEVNVWECSVNEQPFSTEMRDRYHISYRHKPDESGYLYYASKNAMSCSAWKSKEEMMEWARKLKVQFTPQSESTCWAWAYKKKEHHVSPMEFESLDLPEEIFTFNGKKRKCKCEYDDENCTLITHFVWYWDDPTKDFYEAMKEQNEAIEKYVVGWWNN